MIFSSQFHHDFVWQNRPLRLSMVGPEARSKLSGGIKSLSKETNRHRFFGIKNGFTENELTRLTEIDGIDHFAVGVVERWGAERGIAILRMVREEDCPPAAEVAITIIDDYQRQGLGRMLLNLCVLAAEERNISELRFTYLPDNDAMAKLLGRFEGSRVEHIAKDFVRATLRITAATLTTAQVRFREAVGWETNFPRVP